MGTGIVDSAPQWVIACPGCGKSLGVYDPGAWECDECGYVQDSARGALELDDTRKGKRPVTHDHPATVPECHEDVRNWIEGWREYFATHKTGTTKLVQQQVIEYIDEIKAALEDRR